MPLCKLYYYYYLLFSFLFTLSRKPISLYLYYTERYENDVGVLTGSSLHNTHAARATHITRTNRSGTGICIIIIIFFSFFPIQYDDGESSQSLKCCALNKHHNVFHRLNFDWSLVKTRFHHMHHRDILQREEINIHNVHVYVLTTSRIIRLRLCIKLLFKYQNIIIYLVIDILSCVSYSYLPKMYVGKGHGNIFPSLWLRKKKKSVIPIFFTSIPYFLKIYS